MMDERTKQALEASIVKWLSNAEAEHIGQAKITNEDCPLCHLFWDNDCDGCPVVAATGQLTCQGSPYDDANSAYFAWKRGENAAEDFRSAARKEVEFLKSLRDPK